MRVCFVTGEYPPMEGGVADYTRWMARSLRARGVEVTVLTSRRAALPDDEETALSIEVRPVVARWGYGSWPVVESVLASTGASVAHIQYQPAAYALHPAINLLPWWLRLRTGPNGPRVVTTFHDLRGPYICPKAGPLRRWATLALARSSHAAILTNEEDLARVGSAGARAHLIPIGSNILPAPPTGFDREAWRSRLGVRPEEMLVGYFGLINRSKGVGVLLDALRLLRAWGRETRLLIVGGGAGDSDPTNLAYRAEILADIQRWGLDEVATWTGHVSPNEVSALLLSTDMVALPYEDGASFRRGSLLAALAHGCPLVTTHPRLLATSPPALKDGENCRLTPIGDGLALARALDDLGKDPAERRRLGEAAAELARSFTWEQIAEQTLRVYEDTLRE